MFKGRLVLSGVPISAATETKGQAEDFQNGASVPLGVIQFHWECAYEACSWCRIGKVESIRETELVLFCVIRPNGQLVHERRRNASRNREAEWGFPLGPGTSMNPAELEYVG